MNNGKKVRINIEVSKPKFDEIKKLAEISGVSTHKELFDNALTLTRWMMKQRKSGKAVGALSADDRFIELEMPILENASVSNVEF